MKAREWISIFQQYIPNGQLSLALELFVQETTDLAKARSNSKLAKEGAVREQEQKFRKVAEHFPKYLDLEVLHQAFQKYAPGLITKPKQHCPEFQNAYKRLHEAGVCDKVGSQEYYRVLKEWLAAAKPQAQLDRFIAQKANKIPESE